MAKYALGVLFLSFLLMFAGPISGANVPVVFIPGILGSELVDQSGTKVWGPLVPSLRNFRRLEFPRDPAQDKIRAVGLVNEVQILGPFKIEQYSGLLRTLKDLGFQEGRDLFIFPYDWRQSNFDTARELRTFVQSKRALRGRFRILAHSMGGLVARIFIDQYPEGKHVDRFITMGTPHLGSHAALRPMLEGLGTFENTLAGGDEIVRHVAFSLPSLYEMLPFYGGCCVRGNSSERFDLLADTIWDGFLWLPAAESSQPARGRRQEALRRAREIRDLVRRGLPEGTTLFPIAGALLSTHSQIRLSQDKTVLQWGLDGSGDGTVVEGSAAAGSLLDARVAIRRHSTIFEDGHVKVQLARLLVDDHDIEQFGSTVVVAEVNTQGGKRIKLSRVEFGAEPPLARVQQVFTLTLSVFNSDGQRVMDLAPSAIVSLEESGLQQSVSLVGDTEGVMRGTFRPEVAGSYRLSVSLPGVDGVFEEYVVVTTD